MAFSRRRSMDSQDSSHNHFIWRGRSEAFADAVSSGLLEFIAGTAPESLGRFRFLVPANEWQIAPNAVVNFRVLASAKNFDRGVCSTKRRSGAKMCPSSGSN